MARGLNGNPDGSVSAIEIPPPRPKRKPIHPYPRKTLDAKGISYSYQSERSPSPILSSVEKETGSPTSVLSSIYSEGQQSGSCSPTSCTTEVPCIRLLAAGKLSKAHGEEFGEGSLRSTRRKLPSTVSYLFTCNRPLDWFFLRTLYFCFICNTLFLSFRGVFRFVI